MLNTSLHYARRPKIQNGKITKREQGLLTDFKPRAFELLGWYDRHARSMPWRSPPGGPKPDAYHVWLSEIMLQQTTVVTVGPYFLNFLKRWPTVEDLAAAPLDDVLHAWAGLGYYARARNLHKCAKAVVDRFGGRFPAHEAELLELPGIGPYTAAAIAAIAFHHKATVVDGNVERVMARLYAVREQLPDAKPKLKALAAALTPELRAGDYAQGVMDLGATVCTPRSPDCGLCPWAKVCKARALGIAEELPLQRPKAVRPTRRGHIFWCEAEDAAGHAQVLIRRRPEVGLLGGMMEFPGNVWQVTSGWGEVSTPEPPVQAVWVRLPGVVTHVFTHFSLELAVHYARVERPVAAGETDGGHWQRAVALHEVALPTVMKKVIAHVGQHRPEDKRLV
jgi:A/G-specific adenine glycosylase